MCVCVCVFEGIQTECSLKLIFKRLASDVLIFRYSKLSGGSLRPCIILSIVRQAKSKNKKRKREQKSKQHKTMHTGRKSKQMPDLESRE